MWTYIFVFLCVVVIDIVYTLLVKSVQNDKPLAASSWASAITFLNAIAVVNYIEDNKMIIPAVLGAFVGTYIGMRYHIGDRIGQKN